MNLLVEYNVRHKDECILPTNDGICFFNKHDRPALICLTSVGPKVFESCAHCGLHDLTIETFLPHRDSGFTKLFHHHIHPDTDLIKYIKSHNLSGTPVYLKNTTEMECWLWHFFIFHNRLHFSPKWKAWADRQSTDGLSAQREQMVNCAINHPRSYAAYYRMYQTFMIGRKYLLVK